MGRRLIYREWWALLIALVIAMFPWLYAADEIGDLQDDRSRAWQTFLAPAALGFLVALSYVIYLHRQGRLLPKTKAVAAENAARTARVQKYWIIWGVLGVLVLRLPLSPKLVVLGFFSGAFLPMIVSLIANAIRLQPEK